MNKEIRDKCSVEIIECIYVNFKGFKPDKDSLRCPVDDGVLVKFKKFCGDNEIFPPVWGSVSGPGMYSHNHETGHKEKIIDFFKSQGIKVEEFHTNE